MSDPLTLSEIRATLTEALEPMRIQISKLERILVEGGSGQKSMLVRVELLEADVARLNKRRSDPPPPAPDATGPFREQADDARRTRDAVLTIAKALALAIAGALGGAGLSSWL